MKILLIGGMHGNEPLGIKLVKMFRDKQIKNVDAIFANQKAIKANCRFISQDLNRSFPGNIRSKIYEQKRAAKIIKICRQYDLVLDFHNTYCPDNDCSFVGKSAIKSIYDISLRLGFNKVIVADYDCINKYAPNCLSVEISLTSKLNSSRIWYKRIIQLATSKTISTTLRLQRFRFAYRISLEDKDRLNLGKKNLKAFKPISEKLASDMNVESPAYPIFIGDKFTPYNYGGLLNKLRR